MLQRNQIATDGAAVSFGDHVNFFAIDLMFPRFWYKSEAAESPLLLTLSMAKAEGVIADLHLYAQQVCP